MPLCFESLRSLSLTENFPSQALAKKPDRVQMIHRWTAYDSWPHKMVKLLYFESKRSLRPGQDIFVVFNQWEITLLKHLGALGQE